MEAMTTCAHCARTSEGRPNVCPHCSEDPRVQNRYRLEGVLGRGATGVTWSARREPGGAPLCLKELRWAHMGSLDDERRFVREGKLLEALDHPGIPKHHGAFAWGEGRAHALFIAQELVVGDNLEVERKARGYTSDELRAMAVELAEVLDYLHSRHPPVVHRDIKPSNIMRRADGRLVLIDFGAARVGGLSQSLSVAGTFGFMAPEQIRGEAGAPADIYGLGMTLAVLAAGGAAEDLLDATNTPDLRRIPKLPQNLRSLLEAMCAYDPSARPSAARVVELLTRRAAPEPPPPERRSAQAQNAQGKPASKAGAKIGASVGLSVVLGIVGVVASGIMSGLRSTPPSMPAVSFESMEAARQRVEDLTEARSAAERARLEAAAMLAPTEALEPVVEDPLPGLVLGCSNGGDSSCEELGALLEREPERLKSAPNWPTIFVAGCDAGSVHGCATLAVIHARGLGVPQSRIETRKAYGKACALDDLAACNSYGHMLLKGDGGPSDWKAALPPLDKACKAEDLDACLSVGAIYAEGKFGAKIDRAKALAIFVDLCKRDEKLACDNVDAMIGNNWGLPTNPAARATMLTDLCTQGSGAACMRLGDAFARGQGVTKDAAAAKTHYTRGCDLGIKAACEKLR